MSSLERLGWCEFFDRQVSGDERRVVAIARAVEQQRGLYRVAGEFDGWAALSGRLRHESSAGSDLPAVGDWVAVSADRSESADGASQIVRRLDRRTMLSRRAAGRAGGEQVVAANLDTVFIVTAFGEDLNLHRLERYLAMVWNSGANPVVLVNKVDASENAATDIASVCERLPFVDAHAVSAQRGDGIDALAPYLQPARTIGLVGSSGVGKSTLVNRLLGWDRQAVVEVRRRDGTGRHATTARSLVELGSGALLIDTPGMRELQPWSAEEGLESVFGDIDALAAHCRFADCRHETEPGCAVLEAVGTGRLDGDRLEHYRHLVRESAFEAARHDKAAQAETKRRWKQISQAQKKMYKDRAR